MATIGSPKQNGLVFLALLALCGAAVAQEPQARPVEKMKKPAAASQLPQPNPVSPDLARLSGRVEIWKDHASDPLKNAACSSIDVKIERCTNCYQPNQTKETLATLKAMGGNVGNGCTYTAVVPKGPGTIVSAVLPTNLCVPPLQPPPNGPLWINGWTALFDLQTNMSKDVIIQMQFF